MSTSTALGAGRRSVLIRGNTYPVVLPRAGDPRLHLAAAIVTLQVLGQTALGFQLSIAQILVAVGTCAVLETAIVFRRQKALIWPASALLTGNGVAFILRVPGTEHGDWWSLHGAWIFAGAAGLGLLTKHVIRVHGRHILNPSNAGLVLCFLLLAETQAQPLDFWWGPMSIGLAAAIAIIIGAGIAILARLRMLVIAAAFWLSFAAAVAVLAASGHSMTARWHLGPIEGWSFWWLLVSSPEILIFLFFMITDPKTTPAGARARAAYGIAVGLLAGLLIAPQTTEYATKVAVLAALAVVCIGRPLLERVRVLRRRPGSDSRDRLDSSPRRVGAIAVGGLVLYAVVLVAAGLPARSSDLPGRGTMTASRVDPAGIDVTVAPSPHVASQLPRSVALRMAADVVASLGVQAEALRTRDPAVAATAAAGERLGELEGQIQRAQGGPLVVPTYRIEHVLVALSPGPDQRGPRLLAMVRGTVERSTYAGSPARLERRGRPAPLEEAFELAATPQGYVIAGSADDTAAFGAAGAASALAPAAATVAAVLQSKGSVAQGRPLVVRAILRNRADSSRPVTLSLALHGPRGAPVAFHELKLIVPGNGRATIRVLVTPSQWFRSLGRFRIVASVDRRRSGAPAVFDVTRPEVLVPRFEDVTAKAGLTTTMPAPGCGQFSNGAAWGDVNSDGAPDLFLTRLGQPARLFVSNGRGQFREQASARGAAITDAIGAAFADYDNDGRVDLYIARKGNDILLHNTGDGHFRDVTRSAGIRDRAPGSGAAWADYDNDGRLDLYVTSYVGCRGAWTNPYALTTKVRYYPDRLYRNRGDGTFADVTSLLGPDATNGAGFAAAWFDYNGDNRPDLYLGNDFIGERPDHNRLWRNDGRAGSGTFADVSAESATALFNNTMGIAVGDFDRDLRLDLALSNIGANVLLRNRGGGTFADIAGQAGVARPIQRATAQSITWGVGSYDFNLDAWEDLYFAAGDIVRRAGREASVQRNELFVNDATGRRFLDLSGAGGTDGAGDSKGLAFADYDRDGRVDIAVVNQGGSPQLYRNVTPRDRNHWLEVDPEGTVSNRDGCGARVVVRLKSGARMIRQVFCSGNEMTAHFGLGRAEAVAGIEILWPSGIRQQVRNVEVDRRLAVKEPER